MSKIYDVIVVGLGAAGLFAMANLNSDLEVLGIERNRAVGVKLAITGGGRCNLTNDDDLKKLVASYTDPAFARPIIYGFNNQKAVEYFKSGGLPLLNENGRFYPKSQRSKDVINFFLEQINKKGHRFVLNEEIIDIRTSHKAITLTAKNKTYHCQNLIIATGGATYPNTGSDGKLLKKCFDISPFEAALSPLYVEQSTLNAISGVSLAVIISYHKRHFSGNLLLAGNMLSGPVIYDLSNYIALGEVFQVDFAPQLTRQAIAENIRKIGRQSPKKLVKTAVLEVINLPQSFVKALIDALQLQTVTLASLKTKDLTALIELIKTMPLTVQAKAPLVKATVSKGGIKTADIDNKTMMLKRDSRIFVVGEAIELVGACGGYSLQFAFSSAYRAVQYLNSE